mgnify:CR=1 FL=1
MYANGVVEIACSHEESSQPLFSTRDDSCIVTKQQTSQHRRQHDGEEIGFAALLGICHVTKGDKDQQYIFTIAS